MNPARLIWYPTLTAVLLTGCAGGATPVHQPDVTTSTPVAKPAPTMGTPVHDGAFQFVVSGVRTGPSVSSAQAISKATGRYAVIGMSLTNTGDRPEPYEPLDQTLIVEGKRYSYAPEPTALLNSAMTSPIEPGSRVNAAIAYDIPLGTRPDGIELHGAAGTPGVYVDLNAG